METILIPGTSEYEIFGQFIGSGLETELSKLDKIPKDIPGQIIQNDVNQIKRLVIEHASHYGIYPPIDLQIEEILRKYITYNDGKVQGDSNFIDAVSKNVKGFSYTWGVHKDGNGCFNKMTWWESFVLSISGNH